MKKIAIDIAMIYPGKGGSGGGIWVYSKNLVIHMDRLLENRGDLRVFCFANRNFTAELRNVRLVKMSFARNTTLFRLLWGHVLLPLICFLWRIDLLHKPLTEVPILATSPYAVTIHDFMAEYYDETGLCLRVGGITEAMKRKYFKYMAKRAVRKGRFLFVPTEAIKAEASHLYEADTEKVVVTYEGVEQVLSEPGHHPANSNNVLYVAGFYPHKGHRQAIDVISFICKNYDQETKLLLRGNIHDPLYFDQIKRYADASEFRENIIFMNFSPDVTLSQIYADAGILLLLSEYEGFGLPVIEGQKMGLPVVCSDIPVFREILADSAIYVDPKDIYQAARSVWRVMSDSDLRADLIRKGMENSANFTWDRVSRNVLSAYSTLF